jgi:alkylation response protein AidB-like acyl-CoA dehydrogenase
VTTSHSPEGAAFSPLEAARRLAPDLRAAAMRTEEERRLSAPLVAALTEAGIFRMCVPRALGGGEVDPATLVETLAALAEGDGSAAWSAMIGATSGTVGAYLAADAAAEIYGNDPSTITGGVFAPLGRATAVPGGYRVTGRWAFASGCEHCAWLMGGCVVLDDGKPRLLASGAPDTHLLLFPAGEVEIIDTWNVAGLRGTGSHDLAVTDRFVPAARAVSVISGRPRHPGPLYAFPLFGLLALGIAAVALGLARGAIDELRRLAAAKTPSGSRRLLAERSMVQVQVAEAEATLRAARAFLFDAVAAAWATARAAGAMSLEERALVRLASTHAALSAARVVDLMYNAGGGTSIYAPSPLQRQFRDVHVLTQHIMVSPPTLELTGRVLLGLDTDTAML